VTSMRHVSATIFTHESVVLEYGKERSGTRITGQIGKYPMMKDTSLGKNSIAVVVGNQEII